MSKEEQDALLEALLHHVAFDGWGQEALQRAAAALEMDPVQAGEILPGGARGQVLAFSDWADRAMLAALLEQELDGMGMTAKVALAVRLRFQALEPHREALRRSLSILLQPSNATAGIAALHRTCDTIWNALGDRSTDHNWYSKRMLLGGVISASTLYWLDDSSEGKERTWDFLDRRLRSVVKIGGKLGKAAKAALSVPDRLVRGAQDCQAWRRQTWQGSRS
ncbi:MAG: COQ9 family protein [Rhodospirillales bacterium]|nr:COQ9 family protein [Rhodospirillales bacterium]